MGAGVELGPGQRPLMVPDRDLIRLVGSMDLRNVAEGAFFQRNGGRPGVHWAASAIRPY